MGQDDSCGICGRHYQQCRHYLREHLPRLDRPELALCGRKNVVVLPPDWQDMACDPDDICRDCCRLSRMTPVPIEDGPEKFWEFGDPFEET